MNTASRLIGEFLVDRKVLSRDILEITLEQAEKDKKDFSHLLLNQGLVSEGDLVAALGHQAGYKYIDFLDRVPTPGIEIHLPAEIARKDLAVPVEIFGDELIVAMADPTNKAAIDEISQSSGFKISPLISSRSRILEILDQMYGQVQLGDFQAEPIETRSEEANSEKHEIYIADLLVRVVELGGSDLHLTAGIRPAVRVDGEIVILEEFEILNSSEIRRMIYAVLQQKQRERFEQNLELDLSHSVPGLGRFRMNVFLQRDSMGAVIRVIPKDIPEFSTLGMPPVIEKLADLVRGLVLVTGPTGSGKSTTLASLVDIVNRTKPLHIMTIEDPIEFLHSHKKSIVNQREVGMDTLSFNEALKHVLRQDPDVILVGELRDYETISIAISAAETGHLVFATLHTQDAPQSVDRIIDVFPGPQQQQIRSQLSSALQAIVTQQLIPNISGNGRVPACEILIANPAIRNLIREGKTHQIYSAMQSGGQFGMQTMDMSLAQLVKNRFISKEQAIQHCANADDLRRLMGS